MYVLVNLARTNGPLFPDASSRVVFLKRCVTLAQRRDVSLLAWRMGDERVELLAQGDEAAVRDWARLTQSGHGAWMFHNASSVDWRPSWVTLLRSRGEAIQEAVRIHGLGRDATLERWTSLWDVVGLRRLDFWRPEWLLQVQQAADWHRAAWWGPVPELGLWPVVDFTSWEMIDEAVEVATGRPGVHVSNRNLCVHVAAWCGWDRDEVARARKVSRGAVRKAMRRPPDPGSLIAALAHLRHPGLRALLPEPPVLRRRAAR